VAKQVRRNATLNGLMAKTPFLGLLAAPFGLILAPIVGGTAELLASYGTTEANHEMADDILGLAFRPVAIAPGDTYRAFVFFHVPAPATAVASFAQVVLTIPIEEASTRRTFQSAITIRPLAFYTRVTIWDRPTAGPMRVVQPLSPPGAAEVVLTGLPARPAPVDASLHYRQAVTAAQDGQWEVAMVSLSQTVKADQAHGEAFFGRGVLRARQGLFDEATADFSHAIALGFHLTDLYNHRGIVLARLGRDEQAARDWDTAVNLSPNFPLPLYNRGMLSWAQRRPDAAKKDFETACSLGFDPACFSLSDVETHSPGGPPGTIPPAESRQDASPNPAP
jgi:tetratricopeptide (TPR) repeat protein